VIDTTTIYRQKRWVLGALASFLWFFIFRVLVPIVFWNIPGSPVEYSLVTAQEPTADQLDSFHWYMLLVVDTIPYFLTGFLAWLLSGRRGLVVCMLLLLAWSHWYDRVAMARLTFDYIHMSTYALGGMTAIGLTLLWRKFRKNP